MFKYDLNILKLVIEQLPGNIFIKDLECRFLLCNQNFVKIMQLDTVDQIIGLDSDDNRLPGTKKERSKYLKDDVKVFQFKNKILNISESITCKFGDKLFVNTSKHPIIDSKGRIKALLGIVQTSSSREAYIGLPSMCSKHYHKLFSLKNRQKFMIICNEGLKIYLTKQEMICLALIIIGNTASKISQKLFISRRTVESHVDNIKRKFFVKKKSELVSRALESSFISFITSL